MNRKTTRNNNRGIAIAVILLCGLAACGNERPDPTADVQIERIESAAVSDSQKAEGDMVETISTEEEGDAEDTQNPMSDEISRKTAFRSILEGIYFNHTFPDGGDYGFHDIRDISENEFAVCDIDKDGRDELIICYITTDMAGKISLIYDYDIETGRIRTEFSEFPELKFYDNGVIVALESHRMGLAGDFWPYTLYQYNQETDTYREAGRTDAWDRSLSEEDSDGRSFPVEKDADGDGVVYYIMGAGDDEHNIPMDLEEYNQWIDSYVGEASLVDIPYVNFTLENIHGIQ